MNKDKKQWIAGFCYGMYTANRMDGKLLLDINYKNIHPDLLNMWEAIAKYQWLEAQQRNKQ